MNQSDEQRREELRGLLALGLLAVVWQFQGLLEQLAKSETWYWKIIPTVSYVLTFFWGAYAFLMILGWSDDMLPRSVCRELRWIAKGFLAASFAATIYLFGAAFYDKYHDPALITMIATALVISISALPPEKLANLNETDMEQIKMPIRTKMTVFALKIFLYVTLFFTYMDILSGRLKDIPGLLSPTAYSFYIAVILKIYVVYSYKERYLVAQIDAKHSSES